MRLARAREKPAITRSGITHGGVVLAVNVEEAQSDTVKKLMEQAGALDLVNLTKKWNPTVWRSSESYSPLLLFYKQRAGGKSGSLLWGKL